MPSNFGGVVRRLLLRATETQIKFQSAHFICLLLGQSYRLQTYQNIWRRHAERAC